MKNNMSNTKLQVVNELDIRLEMLFTSVIAVNEQAYANPDIAAKRLKNGEKIQQSVISPAREEVKRVGIATKPSSKEFHNAISHKGRVAQPVSIKIG